MMEPAMIVNSDLHIHKKSKSRTSHGAFFDSFEDDVLSMISHRIAHVAKVPPGTSLSFSVCMFAPAVRCSVALLGQGPARHGTIAGTCFPTLTITIST